MVRNDFGLLFKRVFSPLFKRGLIAQRVQQIEMLDGQALCSGLEEFLRDEETDFNAGNYFRMELVCMG